MYLAASVPLSICLSVCTFLFERAVSQVRSKEELLQVQSVCVEVCGQLTFKATTLGPHQFYLHC